VTAPPVEAPVRAASGRALAKPRRPLLGRSLALDGLRGFARLWGVTYHS
jgi:hypothetical protein